MKKVLLLLLVCFSISMFAQKNELSFSIPFEGDNIYENSFSVNYFRKVDDKNDIGIKTRMQWYTKRERNANFNQRSEQIKNFYNKSFDLVNRWKFQQYKSLSYYTEFGIAMTHKTSYIYSCFNCDIDQQDPPDTSPPYNPNDPNWDLSSESEYSKKSTYFGLTSGMGIDFHLFNKFNLGIAYNYKVYLFPTEQEDADKEIQSIFNINLGYLF